jgi:hypothetical protein
MANIMDRADKVVSRGNRLLTEAGITLAGIIMKLASEPDERMFTTGSIIGLLGMAAMGVENYYLVPEQKPIEHK